ncbi:MAG: penicillin acylase family protein [Candidatus Thorarchaeota archaeon]
MSDLLERMRASLSRVEGDFRIDALEEDVEVIRDAQGVPHIYAKNLHDLFLAQGYVIAQDRLWQMEMIRRTTSGTLSEIFGESTLKSDIFYRNLGLNRIAEKLAQNADYKQDHIAMVSAYNLGINEYISENKDSLPIGYQVFQFGPHEFTIKDSILSALMISFGLTSTHFYKFLRLNLIEKLGQKTALSLFPVNMTPSFAAQMEYEYLMFIENSNGSNNWVVSGEKSASGKPLLANDPHLMVTIPGIWYQNHLNAPKLNVIGFSIPGLPGITIGHNDHIGWGCTNSFADVQDLYIEKVNHDNPNQYLSGDVWQDFKIVEETVKIRGKEPLKKTFKISKHGPILESLFVGTKKLDYLPIDKSYKLGYKSIENEFDITELFAAIFHLNKAKNWISFKEAIRHWILPSQNIVYADIDGNIGFYVSGKVPIRKKGMGVAPVPGWTNEYEWDDYIPFEEMPHSLNPGANFIATANNKIVPGDYPYLITNFYSFPDRVNRITELLLDKQKLDVEDFKRIQQDIYSQRAKEICEYFTKITPDNELQKKAIELLETWDFQMSSDSAAALIYHVWVRKFLEVLLKDKLDNELYIMFIPSAADPLYYLKYPSTWMYPGESDKITTNRDNILRSSLQQALEDITAKHGGNIENWRWGLEHLITFVNMLSGLHPDLSMLNRGPFELPGDTFTVNSLWRNSLDNYNCVGGVSFRMVLDFSDLSKSVAIAPPGQSEHPMSTHYSDMIEPWMKGKYHQMLFRREDIKRERKAIMNLKSKE